MVEAKIGGLVGVNNGSISNSYVGLNAANYENEGSSSDQRSLTTSESQAVITYPFNIVAGKSVGGFVDTNSGILANSYVLGVGVSNTGMILKEQEQLVLLLKTQLAVKYSIVWLKD